ncbi:unnamed protein product [Didymodactylos carnosus]|uniref:[histone H3]-lysine(27) N-trimethyltransferase n=1 Tax=Didymodactylos carnosus TaxID=1234261 RepID=A0A813PPH4_9BILA|nr:unnamed protein product [Didymodactylos carnosus]CAF1124079.1 unnamed protein product [Didymodactylos carnosus]CAF3536788.1 unnamed protein product [Didymodactylos carnosus]CAF3900268.1 unnamed protein product [Didymodactylos carnosus]
MEKLHRLVRREYSLMYHRQTKLAEETGRQLIQACVKRMNNRVDLFKQLPNLTIPLSDTNYTCSVDVNSGKTMKTIKLTSNAIILSPKPSVLEMIAYVPTQKNRAPLEKMKVLPYLGDDTSVEDRKLIDAFAQDNNSDEQSERSTYNKLNNESLVQLLREIMDEVKNFEESFTDEQIIDAIIAHHRDASATVLLRTTMANCHHRQTVNHVKNVQTPHLNSKSTSSPRYLSNNQQSAISTTKSTSSPRFLSNNQQSTVSTTKSSRRSLKETFEQILPFDDKKLNRKITKINDDDDDNDENQDRFLPNIDKTDSIDVDIELLVHSYYKLFCSRCYIYDCPLHPHKNRPERPFPKQVFISEQKQMTTENNDDNNNYCNWTCYKRNQWLPKRENSNDFLSFSEEEEEEEEQQQEKSENNSPIYNSRLALKRKLSSSPTSIFTHVQEEFDKSKKSKQSYTKNFGQGQPTVKDDAANNCKSVGECSVKNVDCIYLDSDSEEEVMNKYKNVQNGIVSTSKRSTSNIQNDCESPIIEIDVSLDISPLNKQEPYGQSQQLVSIENNMFSQMNRQNEISMYCDSKLSLQTALYQNDNQNWTLSDRSLFRAFYFTMNGDLCLIGQLLGKECHMIYEQYLKDTQYFANYIIESNSPRKRSNKIQLCRSIPKKHLSSRSQRFIKNESKHCRTLPVTLDDDIEKLPKSKKGKNQRKSEQQQQQLITTLKGFYEPCFHDGECSMDNNCLCVINGTYCEKFCQCSSLCRKRFPGCGCRGSCTTKSCLCFSAGRECDADLCYGCGAARFPPIDYYLNEEKQNYYMHQSNLAHQMNNEIPKVHTDNIKNSSNKRLSVDIEEEYEDEKDEEIKQEVKKRRSDRRVSLSREYSLRSTKSPPTTTTATTRILKKIKKKPVKQPPSSSNVLLPTLSALPISCANTSLQRRLHKQILIAPSDVVGYGAFLGLTAAKKGDLIAEYTGELISQEEAERRGALYDRLSRSYLFNLDSEHVIDAARFGNKVRFANHSNKPNCRAQMKMVNGDYRIGIYAKQDINVGDELFFDYYYGIQSTEKFVGLELGEKHTEDGIRILRKYPDGSLLVRPSIEL